MRKGSCKEQGTSNVAGISKQGKGTHKNPLAAMDKLARS